uniref:Uncharacterized protein n=1 Tax=Anguilla anguilla TaxID=7936 RepID=A0A0E9W9M7_ANGAN
MDGLTIIKALGYFICMGMGLFSIVENGDFRQKMATLEHGNQHTAHQ